jgi:DNA-binding transcriptional LysR family regulator
LRTFLDVAATGNFSRTAKLRQVAVSSITRRIDWLEAQLTIKLFHRNSRLVMLTDAGELFVPRARTILAELAEAKEAMTALSTDPRGLLTVTAPSAFGRRHIAPAVSSFLQKYPSLEVDLHVSDDIVDLTAHRVDVAIRIGILPDSDLLATYLAPHTRIACASPEYIARHGKPETPLDLLKHNCLNLTSKPLPPGWWRFAGVNNGEPLAIKGNLRSDDTDTLLRAALCGLGILHIASWSVYDAISQGRLIPLFRDLPRAPHASEPAIYAVRMPGRSHQVKTKLFIDHLRACFGDTPYWESLA